MQKQAEQLEKIKVQFTVSKYENNDGFCIYLYQNPETKETYTCVGHNLPKYKNITFEMQGRFKKTQKYGMNFNVETYTEIVENNKKSIISFLSSGIIKGIGKATAEKIYDRFGNDSMDIIENNPDRLVEVNGISKRKATLIKKAYRENKVLKNLMQFLIPLRSAFSSAFKTASGVISTPTSRFACDAAYCPIVPVPQYKSQMVSFSIFPKNFLTVSYKTFVCAGFT